MRFRRKRSDELSINLTPLIDVVFLLLIFFMVQFDLNIEKNIYYAYFFYEIHIFEVFCVTKYRF